MDALEAIMTTRAMRRFTDEPVTDEEVMTCIRAAVQAGSGGNIQPWQYLVVTDADTKVKIGEVYRRAFARYRPVMLAGRPPARREEDERSFQRTLQASQDLADAIGKVPAMVLVLMPVIPWTLSDDEGPLDIGTQLASVYPAVQNLMLAARAQGIGSTLTTVYRIYQDEVREIVGAPESYEIVALVPLGRPKGKFGIARRRPAERVTHWNRFGERRA